MDIKKFFPKFFILASLMAAFIFFNSNRQFEMVYAQAGSCDLFVDNQHAQASDAYSKSENSQTKPWRTIQHAIDNVAAGDTICVKNGTYREQVRIEKTGTSSQPITLQAYPGHTPTISGQGLNLEQGQGLFFVRNSHHLIINGFRVVNSDEDGIKVRASDNVSIINNYVRFSNDSGIGIWHSNYIEVDNNQIVNCRKISGGANEVLTVSNTEDFDVSNNEIWIEPAYQDQYGTIGIDVKTASQRGRVNNNYVHDFGNGGQIYVDAWTSGLPDLNDPTGPPSKIIDDIRIYNNYLVNTSGIRLGSEQEGTAKNLRVYNNIIINAQFAGITVRGNPGPRENVWIVNNTIYKGRNHGGAGIMVETPDIVNFNILNNIVAFGWGEWTDEGWSTGSLGQILLYDSSIRYKVNVRDNIIFGPDRCGQNYPNCVTGLAVTINPRFVDHQNLNFHLSADSPAIDNGTNLSAQGVNADYDGLSRPRGDGFDMGAFEYDDDIPTSTPTLTPTNPVTSTPTQTPTNTATPIPTITPTSPPVGPTCNNVVMKLETSPGVFEVTDLREFRAGQKLKFECQYNPGEVNVRPEFRIYFQDQCSPGSVDILNRSEAPFNESKVYPVEQTGLIYVQCAPCNEATGCSQDDWEPNPVIGC